MVSLYMDRVTHIPLSGEDQVSTQNDSEKDAYISPKVTIINIEQTESGQSAVSESNNGPSTVS